MGEDERERGGVWKGSSGRKGGGRERDESGRRARHHGEIERVRVRERVKWGGLDDVILDIRWNLHCASTLVIRAHRRCNKEDDVWEE